MKAERFTKAEYWLLGGILVCLLPYFLLAAFAQPSADDFFFSAWFSEMDTWTYLRENLTCCNGRYTGVLLAGIMPLSFGSITGMKLIPVLTLTALFFSLRALFVFATDQRSFRTRLLWPSIAMLILLNAFPSTAEGIYWVNASIFHTWAAILIVLMVGLISLDTRRQLGRGLAGSVIVLLVPGMNEIAALLLGIILALHAINTMYSTASRRFWAFVWLFLLLVGIAVVMMMPGTWARAGAMEGNFSFAYASTRAVFLTGLLSGQQLQHLPLLLFSLLVLPRLREVRIPAWDHCRLSGVHWIYTAATSLLVIYILYFAALFVMGSFPPWRLHNTIAILFLLLWFLNLYQFAHQVRVPSLPRWASIVVALLAFWFILSDINVKEGHRHLSFRGNTTRAWYDLLVEGPEYQEAMSARYRAIRESSPADTVVVPKLHLPPTIAHADIGENPASLYNAVTAYYFGVAAVRTEKEEGR